MSPTVATLALRVMRTVARCDGETATESELVIAAAQLLGASADVDAVEPDELRDAALDPKQAEQVVQAAILTALMDGEVSPSELTIVRAIAAALGVNEPRVKNLEQLAAGRVRAMWVDLARRSWARDVFVRALETEGPRGVWKIVGPMLGRAKDPELAARYIETGALAHDTMGYAYFQFVTSNELPFPGEGNGVAEAGVWHDCAHVLGGYGIEPSEEIQLVSFVAGFSRQDPFFWLFTITLQFHLGISMSPYSAPETGLFDPPAVLRAFQRGAAMTLDLSASGFDPWQLFPRNLEQLRRELNVGPRSA
ncbi:TerB family tellurite resistance protein [Enhygromyxa salina]|nr:TerB family tellurite resistance protein [Enhygromyxa salina]